MIAVAILVFAGGALAVWLNRSTRSPDTIPDDVEALVAGIIESDRIHQKIQEDPERVLAAAKIGGE